MGLVLAGGAVGTGLREAVVLTVPPVGGVPLAILAVNVVGAFLLGVLLDGIARRGPDRGRRRSVRLLLGTGVLGGFTTFSALAVDTAGLLAAGAPVEGLGYGFGTVLLGAAATWAGIVSACLTHRRREATQ